MQRALALGVWFAMVVGCGNSTPSEFRDCGCGCCGGIGAKDEIICTTSEDIANRLEVRRERDKDPMACANVGCSQGARIYRVCDGSAAPPR